MDDSCYYGTQLDLVEAVPDPAKEESQQPQPSEAFNRVANAVLNPIGAAAEILSPENVSKSQIPFEWAVVGICVVLVIWAGSWMGKAKA